MSEFPVFIKQGDARAEVDAAVRQLGATPEDAGLHKYFYVTKAAQTVVMVSSLDSALAKALRGQPGWEQPNEDN